jgi:hypothetical protein
MNESAVHAVMTEARSCALVMLESASHIQSELDELLGSEASASDIRSKANLLVEWLRDDITKIHQLVMALESASKQDPARMDAYVLVTESNTNILKAITRTRAAADSLRAEADET